jgi:hypothetical protein
VLDLNLSSHQPQPPPPLAPVSSPSYPIDANASIDHLTHRLKTLEFRIGDLEAEDAEYQQSARRPVHKSSQRKRRSSSSSSSPPPRSTKYFSSDDLAAERTQWQQQQLQQQQQATIEFLSETLKELLHKLQKYKQNSNEMTQAMKFQYKEINEQLAELKSENEKLKEMVARGREHDRQVDLEMKAVVEKMERSRWKSSEVGVGVGGGQKKEKERGEGDEEEIEFKLEKEYEAMAAWTDQVKLLQKKVKLLSHNTNKVCKSLSVGISDSQYSILLIFSWAEKVYNAFEILSREMNIEGGLLCPRLQLRNQKGDQLSDENEEEMNIPNYFQGQSEAGRRIEYESSEGEL